MKSFTIGAIVLGPRNIQGQYNYMSLETGEKIDGRVVAILPLTNDVINRVESLGQYQKQPFRESRMLQYEWRPGQPIGNNNAYVQHATINKDVDIIFPHPITQQKGSLENLEDNNNEYVYVRQGAETLQVNDAIQDINIVEDQGAQGAQGDESKDAQQKSRSKSYKGRRRSS